MLVISKSYIICQKRCVEIYTVARKLINVYRGTADLAIGRSRTLHAGKRSEISDVENFRWAEVRRVTK